MLDYDYTELEEYLKKYEERFKENYVTLRPLSPNEVIEDIKKRLKSGEKVEEEDFSDEEIPKMY